MSEQVVLELKESISAPDAGFPKAPSMFCFSLKDKEIIRISEEDGIKFSLENFPDWTPDDFAKAFVDILQKIYRVKFEEK